MNYYYSCQLTWYRLIHRISSTKPSKVFLMVAFTFTFLVLFLTASPALTTTVVNQKKEILTQSQLEHLLQDVRGDDKRIMRWDATEHTAQRQVQGGACDSLPAALESLVSWSTTTTTTTTMENPNTEALICEYATFCITDNPWHRSQLAQIPGIHKAIVDLVASPDSHTSAMASHLIYIATFANADNHQGFFHAGAVTQLARVLQTSKEQDNDDASNKKATTTTFVQVMWAAAAIQNLAASYCETQDDGRCYWSWHRRKDVLKITRDSLPMTSDGTQIRQELLLHHPDLVEILIGYTCLGPVQGKMSTENPYPGENAVIGTHDDASSNLLAWAAAGALKNIALFPQARERIESSALPCLCHLSQSPDWLEENKGNGAIEHLRRDDPCWFNREGGGDDVSLCVDLAFYDDEEYTCSDYGEATAEECLTKDWHGVSAKDACCGCGGGIWEENKEAVDEL